MHKLYMMCGITVSGKTTLVKKMVEYTHSELIDVDELFGENGRKLHLTRDPEGHGRDIVRKIALEKLRSLLLNNSVVYDDMNQLYKHREQLRGIAKDCNAIPILIYVKTPLKVIQERRKEIAMTREGGDVPEPNFQYIVAHFEEPQKSEHPIIYIPNTKDDVFLKKLMNRKRQEQMAKPHKA